MARRKIFAGSTSVNVPIFVNDSSSTTGAGLGSLTSSTSGLVCEYRRSGDATWTTITLAGGTLGTWSSGGFVADGGLSGAYSLGIPNAVLASGVTWSQLRLYGAANMVPVLIEFELDAVNYQDAVRFGLSALPNAAANASGGVYTIGGTGVTLAAGQVPSNFTSFIIDTSGRVQVQYGTSTGQVNLTSGNLADKTGCSLAPSGLDAVSATMPTGRPTTFPGWLMWLARRFGNKTMVTASSLVMTADDNTTPTTTQTVNDDGTTVTVGPAS